MFGQGLVDRVLALPRGAKRAVALLIDALLCAVSLWLALYFRLGDWPVLTTNLFYSILFSIVLALPIFITFGLYRAIFRYAGMVATMTIAKAVVIYAIPYVVIYSYVGVVGMPRTIGFLQPLLLLMLVASSRAVARAWLGGAYQAAWHARDKQQVLIYGAGGGGRQLAQAMHGSHDMRLVGFLDDDAKLWRSTINGVKIFGLHDLEWLVERHNVTDILLALPSVSRARRTEIVHQLKGLGLHVRMMPTVTDLARGDVSVNDLKELEIEDLLGRSAIPPHDALLRKNVDGKVVLVTGAGGSIGGELCRQIAALSPAMLLLVDSSEYNLYAIHQELTRAVATNRGDTTTLLPLLASVRDQRRMEEIISTWRPDTIYHAAAYKHVPLVEHNPIEGIANNVIGTLNVAQIARRCGVSSFVLISTDKAVRPTNIMGTTKRFAEMVLQAFNAEGGNTCFSMVRFGNVLGSSGSVVPLFRSQIAVGGPITITHADITRYFMTIPEAAQLVLQAGAMAVGGDVFVLDMGEPVRIIDLARNMIELSGLRVRDSESPDGDIEIKVVGLRPGEKLYEELLIGCDPTPSSHPRILRAREAFLSWQELGGFIASLTAALDAGDAVSARALLRDVVPEYYPNSDLVDLVSQHRLKLVR